MLLLEVLCELLAGQLSEEQLLLMVVVKLLLKQLDSAWLPGAVQQLTGAWPACMIRRMLVMHT